MLLCHPGTTFQFKNHPAGIAKQILFRILTVSIFCICCISLLKGQKIISYGPNELTASIHYNEFLYGIYENYYKKLPPYPIKGVYSPTHYADGSSGNGMSPGVGVCSYIYFHTNGRLLPGQQYRLRLTVKVGKAYAEMPYFQAHFGVALSSDLFKNYFGLWNKHFIPLDIGATDTLVTQEIIFRPLCSSTYLVLGVFQGPNMDTPIGFAEQYGFELYQLSIERFDDPEVSFVYMCDTFEEERMKKLTASGLHTDTVYFERGSSAIPKSYIHIIDSIPLKLHSQQDLIILYAYTSKEGSDNEALGAARNIAIRDALITRGVDVSNIFMVNFGDSRASDQISIRDRKVEIEINQRKLPQVYYTEALKAVMNGEYKTAQAMLTHWVKFVSEENAIYALFDCWGSSEKTTILKQFLAQQIKSRSFYNTNGLKFKFDSLYCEDQRGRTLQLLIRANRLPYFQIDCYSSYDSLYEANHHLLVDGLYATYGFPRTEVVGERGNKVIPYMILHTSDTLFQRRYLPIVQKACEAELISWEYYAMLYDKINIVRNGHQRYGTQYVLEDGVILKGLYPVEDPDMVAEYRKQVGLPPLSDF